MLSSFAMLVVLAAAAEEPGRATGFCERDGKTLSFVDAIAFPDARDKEGATTTTLYLVSVALDRKALAECLHCGRPLPEKPLRSARRAAVEAQVRAANGGWLHARRFGGPDATVLVIEIQGDGPDGTSASIMLGNERVTAKVREQDDHIAGKVSSDAGFGNRCDAVFDFKLGWPKLEKPQA